MGIARSEFQPSKESNNIRRLILDASKNSDHRLQTECHYQQYLASDLNQGLTQKQCKDSGIQVTIFDTTLKFVNLRDLRKLLSVSFLVYDRIPDRWSVLSKATCSSRNLLLLPLPVSLSL